MWNKTNVESIEKNLPFPAINQASKQQLLLNGDFNGKITIYAIEVNPARLNIRLNI